MASNEDIMLALGRLQASVERLRGDFSEEKKMAHESRTAIHRRLDEQVTQVALLDKTVGIQAQIDSQMRDKIDGLASTVRENRDAVEPVIEDMKRLKLVGYGISGMIAIAGVSVGGLIWWAGEAAVTAVRHWLKIP